MTSKTGLLPSRNDMPPRSRDARSARVLSSITLLKGGRRECRVLHPHPQPCVRKVKAHKHSHHRLAETFRHSLRDGFNGFLRDLPGDRACLSPSSARCESIVANLMPASRHQDHTTSPSATAPLVLRRHQRPSHPAFHVRDDASAPPDERGTELALLLFLPNEKAKYFLQEGWTRRANQCRHRTSYAGSTRVSISLAKCSSPRMMDCRVKPGQARQ
jgi:hypothetical protein